MDFQNSRNDYIEWKFPWHTEGSAIIAFRYAYRYGGSRPLQLNVNGQVLNPRLDFPLTGGGHDWDLKSVEVPLVEGINSVRITAIGQSGPNFDYLSVGQPGKYMPVTAHFPS